MKSEKTMLDDFSSLFLSGPDKRPSPIEAAIYLEDCFDLVLSDEEIAALDPEDPESLGRLLAAKARP